jgi:hypothetical protein
MDEEGGQALASTDNDHSHEIYFVPPNPGGVDPQTGLTYPPDPGGWKVAPAQDGHSHEIEDFNPQPKKKKEDPNEIIKEVYSLFRAAKEYEKDAREKAKEAEEFYCGEQWPKEVKAELERTQRAALTINVTQKNVDELSGHQRQQRTDISYVPPEEGDQRVADILKYVSKHILEKCYYPREESKAFEDEIIVGRGNLCMTMDFDTNLQGDLMVRRFPWEDIVYGPHEFEDLSDCEHLHKHKMYSKAKLKQLFADKADDIEADYKNLLDWIEEGKMTVDVAGDEYAYGDDAMRPLPVVGDTLMYDVARKEFRLIECQKREYERRSVVVSSDFDFVQQAAGWSPKEIASAKTLPGFQVITKNVSTVRILKVCGSTLLEDKESDIGDFDVIPIYAKKRGAKWWGKVELVKDPQREINKRHSQAVDIGNKVCAYGFGYDEDTFSDQAEAERFKKNVATPGFVTKLVDVNRPPYRFEGVKFPNEIVQLMALGADQIKGLMNITPDEGGANTSGFALMQRQKSKLVGNGFLFDNLSFAKKKIGKLLVKFIQLYYTPQRIYRILQNRHQKEPIEVAGQPLDKYPEDEIIELLQRSDLAEYDVEVSESAYSPSIQLATAAVLSELAKTGFPVPPPMLIELFDLPGETKQKFQQAMMQQQQAQAQAEQAKATSELMKPLVAKGIIPPPVQQMMQMGPGANGNAPQGAPPGQQ